MQAETGRIFSILYSEHFEVPRDRPRRRAGRRPARSARSCTPSASARTGCATRPAPGLVLRPRALRRHPDRHRLAPGRAVPVLHRRRRRQRALGHRREPRPTRTRPGCRTSATCTSPPTRATGMIRVDWFTPDGLPTWGDGRLIIVGTEGTIELRKYVDLAGRPGTDHLFLPTADGVRHIDCAGDRPAVRPPARRRHPRPHRDGDAAGALLQGDGDRAEGADARRGERPVEWSHEPDLERRPRRPQHRPLAYRRGLRAEPGRSGWRRSATSTRRGSRRVGDEFGIEGRTTSFDDLLADPDDRHRRHLHAAAACTARRSRRRSPPASTWSARSR